MLSKNTFFKKILVKKQSFAQELFAMSVNHANPCRDSSCLPCFPLSLFFYIGYKIPYKI
ncbi:hypothetical protein TREVI0001_2461 [Treponema vincentii ATCC 35580]|uniref:Uncharacterized protein n=1 Tax=Treponema vincentii ATCC 35580 TaxID=596324 RepID=C8PSS1_9SPIR|nr:hypothetical protein TREVI0001_2461 [Treponema vincentii ATCC 35580]